jgi:hypothetical protein
MLSVEVPHLGVVHGSVARGLGLSLELSGREDLYASGQADRDQSWLASRSRSGGRRAFQVLVVELEMWGPSDLLGPPFFWTASSIHMRYGPSAGSSTLTRVPRPGSDSIAALPPAASTRSINI